MKEPSLEAVLECLSDVGYCFEKEDVAYDVTSAFFEKRKNVDHELEQLLFFCRKEQASTFEHAISQIQDDVEKERIESALIAMYPVTKNVILEMLKNADMTPAQYLEVFDFDQTLLKSIKDTLNKIRQSSTSNNVDANKYSYELEQIEKEIKKLSAKRDEMSANIKDYKKKVEEKNNLEIEIERLENADDLDASIDKLRNDKNRLDKQKREKEEEKGKLEEEIRKLNEYLQSVNDRTEDADYKKALKSLEGCIKALSKGR